MREYKQGQRLIKLWDGIVVTIAQVKPDCIILDGDFEPNHVVMKDRVWAYYGEYEDGEQHA